jgi:hypothetical protein
MKLVPPQVGPSVSNNRERKMPTGIYVHMKWLNVIIDHRFLRILS